MLNIYKYIISLIVLTTLVSASCNDPKITSKTFTTQDATIVSQIAFISEFKLECSNIGAETLPLFADIDGKIMPVARINENNFQVSWTEEIKKAYSGKYTVRLFDEEGFGAVRKAQRAGENINLIKPLTTIIVAHPGAFNGPLANAEMIVAALSVCVAYFAFATKGKILS